MPRIPLSPLSIAASALAALCAAAVPAHACALALVIAMDGSSSVNEKEHRLQLSGLSQALADTDVTKAIEAVGGIWFSSFEWSGRYQQSVQIGWRFLQTAEEAERTAAELSRARRAFMEFPTALGYALGYAAVHLRKVPETCMRQVVDVAGDGITNEGFDPARAYTAFAEDYERITVNGLAIAGADPDPVAYYRDHLIHGPGAFAEVADGFSDYERAMKRKLLREITASISAGNGRGTTGEKAVQRAGKDRGALGTAVRIAADFALPAADRNP